MFTSLNYRIFLVLFSKILRCFLISLLNFEYFIRNKYIDNINN